MAKKYNLVLIGIDSLRSDHMSLYGYERLTTPHIDKFAKEGIMFEQCFSPSIPTTSGYASMFTGMDCFGTNIVALRHKGGYADGVKTLAEVLNEKGYNTTCVGFDGNPASRGFSTYLPYEGWSIAENGRAPKAENLNKVVIPELERLVKDGGPFFLLCVIWTLIRHIFHRIHSKEFSTGKMNLIQIINRWNPYITLNRLEIIS